MAALTQQSAPCTNLNLELTFVGAGTAAPLNELAPRPPANIFCFETNQNPSLSALNDFVLERYSHLREEREVPKTRDTDSGWLGTPLFTCEILASRVSGKRARKPGN